MLMIATIIRSDRNGYLVRNLATGEEVYVNFRNAPAFPSGTTVRITYTGMMTASIPPQITATSVVRMPQPTQPQPSQTIIRNATILQVRNNSLTVRNSANSQQMIVNYRFAHHFCVGQRVDIPYDTITFTTPQQVNATDVLPIC